MYGGQMIGALAMLLISLSLGYLVCVQARVQNKFLKIVGYILGAVIIISSIVLLIGPIKAMSVKKDPQKLLEQLLKSGALSGSKSMPMPMQKRLPSDVSSQN